jgi:hypothetical protein
LLLPHLDFGNKNPYEYHISYTHSYFQYGICHISSQPSYQALAHGPQKLSSTIFKLPTCLSLASFIEACKDADAQTIKK